MTCLGKITDIKHIIPEAYIAILVINNTYEMVIKYDNNNIPEIGKIVWESLNMLNMKEFYVY